MTRMTIAQARKVADTPSVSIVGQRIPVERLVEASQILDCEGHGDGRDGRRLRALLLTIKRRHAAAARAVGQPDSEQAHEWNRINRGAAFQHHAWGI